MLYEIVRLYTFSSEDESIFFGKTTPEELEYIPFSKAMENLQFSYEVNDQDPSELDVLKIKLLFLTPRRVSQSNQGRDKLVMYLEKN